VVGQQPRQVGDALPGRLLDVAGDRGVALAARGPREDAVGHVPDEDVLERELGVARDLAGGLPADEVPRFQGVEAGHPPP
jgi:hypothetical protein